MATVELKCANCGAALKPKVNYYACEYCGSLIFQLIEEGGFTEVSLSIEQFREKLKQSGRIFTVESAQIKTDDADKKNSARKNPACAPLSGARLFLRSGRNSQGLAFRRFCRRKIALSCGGRSRGRNGACFLRGGYNRFAAF